MTRQLDVVFEGGGARGLVQNGAVAALEEQYELRRLVGTSAGAITATLCALGYGGEDLRRISLETRADGRSRMTEFISEPRDFEDAAIEQSLMASMFSELAIPGLVEHMLVKAVARVPGSGHVFSLLEAGGWFSASGFVDWLGEHIAAKVGRREVSFSQLFEHTGKDLTVVTADTTTGAEVVLNHRTAPDCPVLYGVRMSMSIPFLWPEVTWRPQWGSYAGEDIAGNTFVDGGVSSNFALNLLLGGEGVQRYMGPVPEAPADLMGLWIDLAADVPGAPAPTPLLGHSVAHTRAAARLLRLINTLMTGSDVMVAEAHRDLVCRLPARGYGVAEFDMSPQRITALVDAGENGARAWLAARQQG